MLGIANNLQALSDASLATDRAAMPLARLRRARAGWRRAGAGRRDVGCAPRPSRAARATRSARSPTVERRRRVSRRRARRRRDRRGAAHRPGAVVPRDDDRARARAQPRRSCAAACDWQGAERVWRCAAASRSMRRRCSALAERTLVDALEQRGLRAEVRAGRAARRDCALPVPARAGSARGSPRAGRRRAASCVWLDVASTAAATAACRCGSP